MPGLLYTLVPTIISQLLILDLACFSSYEFNYRLTPILYFIIHWLYPWKKKYKVANISNIPLPFWQLHINFRKIQNCLISFHEVPPNKWILLGILFEELRDSNFKKKKTFGRREELRVFRYFWKYRSDTNSRNSPPKIQALLVWYWPIGKPGRKLLNHNIENNYCNYHISAVTSVFLVRLKWFVFGHPAYSPNLAPSNYWLFPWLKKFLTR